MTEINVLESMDTYVKLESKVLAVKANLQRTIEGKHKLLEQLKFDLRAAQVMGNTADVMALTATIDFLRVNLVELKKILTDLS